MVCFSIITVTFNSVAYLSDAMASVLSQDGVELEYILVDGGSSDGTLDIIRKYAELDSRIRWTSEPDEGIADAFNKGLRMATGDIIGILNSDDMYAAGALKLLSVAATIHPECGVYHGNMIRLQGDKPLFMLKPSDVDRHIWHEMPLNHPATFVTRHAYQVVGEFNKGLKIAMDYDLILKLYIAGIKFWHINEVLAQMRYGGSSDSDLLGGIKEIFQVSIQQGYPRWKAYYWFVYKGFLRGCKQLLRRLGLYSLMRINPKFSRL